MALFISSIIVSYYIVNEKGEAKMYIIVFVTTGSFSEAEKIADILISKKAAACVNIIQNLESIYWWEGKIESSKESLLIIKTLQDKYGILEQIILENHSYENPEIISFKVEKGSTKYLNWINESLKR